MAELLPLGTRAAAGRWGPGPEAATLPRSQAALAWRRFAQSPPAIAGGLLLLVLCTLAASAPLWLPADPVEMNLDAKLAPPGRDHWMGTDHFGRDVFSRVVSGARVSLSVGLLVVGLVLVLGVPLGLLAGYGGGRVDNAVMRLMDAVMTFPPLLLAVAIMGTLGADLRNAMVALALVYTPTMVRVVRGNVLSVREETFVEAARALGATTARIVGRHVLVNAVGPIVVQATVMFSRAIVAEAALSFLGLGTQPPHPSWGRDLNEARRFLTEAPWLIVFPTVMIMVCVLCINFVGDGLRDALDPRARRR